MNKKVRIGTRDSKLAIWQASKVKKMLSKIGINSSLSFIKSDGDINLTKPVYEMGIQGVFTKSLDSALLNDKIDIAIHSMKDVPTSLASGISQGAVLKRDSEQDVILTKIPFEKLNENSFIGTGSLRRKSQWLSKFKKHKIVPIRGNINTRIKKLYKENIDGIILSEAAIQRLKISNEIIKTLNWMIPAPAQGAIMIVLKSDNYKLKRKMNLLNDKNTEICTKIERDFLKTLQGGCSTPIGAFAKIVNNQIIFKGGVFSLCGSKKITVTKNNIDIKYKNLGQKVANELLVSGGKELIDEFKNDRNAL
jgi:hydroxymethylbilane synthase